MRCKIVIACIAGSPSQFGRYERDNKPAMHVLFWSRQYAILYSQFPRLNSDGAKN
jgi:hypothetical protein